jgi:hypothetical protein
VPSVSEYLDTIAEKFFDTIDDSKAYQPTAAHTKTVQIKAAVSPRATFWLRCTPEPWTMLTLVRRSKHILRSRGFYFHHNATNRELQASQGMAFTTVSEGMR